MVPREGTWVKKCVALSDVITLPDNRRIDENSMFALRLRRSAVNSSSASPLDSATRSVALRSETGVTEKRISFLSLRLDLTQRIRNPGVF